MPALKNISPTLNDTSAAAANTTRLQALLDAGGDLEIIGSGIVYVNTTLKIGSRTHLRVPADLRVKMATIATSAPVLTSKALDRAWATVTAAWSASTNATITKTAHGKAVGDYVCLKGVAGTTDSAFFGVFIVKSVTDANNFVIKLRRVPNASPSGTISMKDADVDVSIEGGIWDYNYTQNPSGSNNYTQFGVILTGIAGLTLRRMTVTDCPKYGFAIGGVRDFIVEHCGTIKTGSDGLKLYGPSFDGKIENFAGTSEDDLISLHTQEGVSYQQYDFCGWGSVLNVEVDGVSASGTVAGNGSWCSVYAGLNGNFEMDNLVLRRFGGAHPGSSVPIRVTAEDATTKIGRLRIADMDFDDYIGEIVNISTLTIRELELDGLSLDIPASKAGVAISSGVIGVFSMKGCRALLGGSGARVVYVSAGTIERISLSDGQFSNGSALGNVIEVVGGTVGRIELCDSAIGILNNIIVIGASATVAVAALRGNKGEAVCGINASNSTRLVFGDNEIANCYNGMARLNKASAAFTIESLGGNRVTGAGVWMARVIGSEIVTARGMDLDLDVTALARVTGAFCRNSNAAAGTLGAAGLVVCQGTAANSWHLMADPTLVY